jgi:hypothetical protein
MCLFSYFWDSGIHLEKFSLSFESVATLIDLLVAIWLWKAFRDTDSNPIEENERRKERLEIAFGLITALCLFVAVSSFWRILNLNERDEANSAGIIDVQSNKLAQTEALLEIATNNVLALVEKAKDRTIVDMQSNLFMLLVKDYPKTPIKVFVGVEDNETDRYARKIKQMLDAAGYGDNTADIIRIPGGIVVENLGAEGIFSTNALVFVSYGTKGGGTFFPLHFTNDPVVKLYWAESAFSKIGLGGVFIKDDTLLKTGELGIIVPLKNH